MEILDEGSLRSDAAELALIGAVSFHPDQLASVLASLPGDDFYAPSRGIVWDTCRALSAERKPITPVTVARHLAANGLFTGANQTVVQRNMLDEYPAAMARDHAHTVADLARRRELMRAVKRAHGYVLNHPGDHSEALSSIRGVFDELGSHAEERLGGTLTWPELLDEFEAAHAPGVQSIGIPTPWPEVDDLLGGLHGGRMYVVGGSAGDGKSTVALNIAMHAAETGHGVLVFSKEMPTLDVTGRFVARGAEINLAAINGRRLNDFDRSRVKELRKRIPNLPLRVNADPVTITGVKQMARALHHRGKLQILVVDYLQLMTGDKAGRTAEEEIARVSTELKILAMELDIAVVVPAQLNRNPSARADMRPTKADLRGSGRIEQDADVVILLWRQPVKDPHTFETTPDPHHLTFIIDKNRHGPKSEIQLRWNGGYGRVG